MTDERRYLLSKAVTARGIAEDAPVGSMTRKAAGAASVALYEARTASGAVTILKKYQMPNEVRSLAIEIVRRLCP